MIQEEFDAAVGIIAAVNAGIMELRHQRIKQRRLQVTRLILGLHGSSPASVIPNYNVWARKDSLH